MNYREVTIPTASDLKDGEMKQISVEGTEVLLARVKAKYYAVAAHCPHYGAPLVDGVLNGERLICPWHHACFNVTNGDLQEPPALDALPCYDVKIENDRVSISLPEQTTDRRTPEMTKRDGTDKRLFVVVGGGAAGYAAAQTLREDGFKGRILLITRETHLPYDRPNLSKEYLQGNAQPEWLPLRSDDFFAAHDIEVMRGREVEQIDGSHRAIKFADGETLVCDALLLATGGEPRRLPFQSVGQANVFVLRSYADCDRLISAAKKGKRVVVIGSSFIGMETASSLTERGCEVTVITNDHVPFQKTLGTEIGSLFQKVHEGHGVKFKLDASISGFCGEGEVTAVRLENGEELQAELVVVGIGVKPATNLIDGIQLHQDGGVVVDQYMRAADGIYAAGDIAYFPNPSTGERQRIEHWRTALQQGRIAAHNMLGKQIPYDGVPFFWTRQFEVGLLYVGHAVNWTEVIVQGSLGAHDFLAFYLKGDRVSAVAGMNRDKEMAAIEELMRLDRMPTRDQLNQGVIDFTKILQDASALGSAEAQVS